MMRSASKARDERRMAEGMLLGMNRLMNAMPDQERQKLTIADIV